MAPAGRQIYPLLALVAAGALWGFTTPLSKLALEWLGPAWLAAIRFAIAAPLLAVLTRKHLRGALSPAVVISGAAGYGLVLWLENFGLARTSVSHTALIVGAQPVLVVVFVAVASWCLARRNVDGVPSTGAAGGLLGWLGVFAGLAGVGLIAGSGGAGTSLVGDLIVFVAALGAAGMIVAQPRILKGRDAGAVTAVQLGGAALITLPIAAITEGGPSAPAAVRPVAALVVLILCGTIVTFYLFTWAQTRVPPALAGVFVNLEPLVGALTGIVVFGDHFGPAQALGGAAILGGITLGAFAHVQRSRRALRRALRVAQLRRPQRGKGRTRRRRVALLSARVRGRRWRPRRAANSEPAMPGAAHPIGTVPGDEAKSVPDPPC